jgi:DNA-binding CsgD family transcriptional regulator
MEADSQPHARKVPKNKRPVVAIVSTSAAWRQVWGVRLEAIPGVIIEGVWPSLRKAREAGVHLDAILVDASPRAASGREGEAALSRREAQVMALLAAGCRDKEVPARLGVSAHTARTFLRRAMAKMGTSSRAEAVAMWLKSEHHP